MLSGNILKIKIELLKLNIEKSKLMHLMRPTSEIIKVHNNA